MSLEIDQSVTVQAETRGSVKGHLHDDRHTTCHFFPKTTTNPFCQWVSAQPTEITSGV